MNIARVPCRPGPPPTLARRGAEVPRFRVSYTFTDQIVGDAGAIRKAVRDLSFSTSFDPDDLNHWCVTRTEDGQHLLTARRMLVDEITEASERAALCKFLYGMDLPDTINVANIHIERLDGAGSSGSGQRDGTFDDEEAAA